MYELEVLVRCGVIPEVTRVPAELPTIPNRGDRVVVQTQRGIELGSILQILSSRPAAVENSTVHSDSSSPAGDTPSIAAGRYNTAAQFNTAAQSSTATSSSSDRSDSPIGESTTAVLEAGPAAQNRQDHDHDHDHDHDANPHDDDDTTVDAERVLRLATSDDLTAFAAMTERARREFPQWQHWITQWKLNIELLDSEWLLAGDRLVLYVLAGRGPETTQLALQAATVGFDNVDVQPVTTEGRAPRQSGGGCGSGGGGCGCSH